MNSGEKTPKILMVVKLIPDQFLMLATCVLSVHCFVSIRGRLRSDVVVGWKQSILRLRCHFDFTGHPFTLTFFSHQIYYLEIRFTTRLIVNCPTCSLGANTCK